MADDSSPEKMSTRRQRNDIFRVKNIGRVGNYQPRILHSKKASFKSGTKISLLFKEVKSERI